jgi:glycosyltransferase involved in cell wall biosynthesis
MKSNGPSFAESNRILALIPAYNEELWIGRLLDRLEGYAHKDDVLVIDDGSSDRTAEIAREHGVSVLSNAQNRGKGFSLRRGFEYALEKGYGWVVTLDADYQHDPKEISDMIDLSEDADIVVCSRWAELSRMPRDRFLSNRLSSMVASIAAGQRLEDAQCGFRLIRTSLFRRIKLTTSRFDTEPELLIKAALAGARIVTCPIHVRYGAETSSINRCIDTLRFIVMTLKLLWK